MPHEPDFKSKCAEWETYLSKYRALAKELKMSIVPGTIVELHCDEEGSALEGDEAGSGNADADEAPTSGERLLNVAYFIGPDGEILGRYVKKNLWGSIERLHLTSSTRDPHPVFDTPLGKVGMLVCWDLAFPEAFREMIAQGAKIFVIPTFWTLGDCSKEGLARNPNAEGLFLDSVLTSRCFENTCGKCFHLSSTISASILTGKLSDCICKRRRPARKGLRRTLASVCAVRRPAHTIG